MARVEKRLKDQIATEARRKRTGGFIYPFGRPYNMTSVVFSIGDTRCAIGDAGFNGGNLRFMVAINAAGIGPQ